MKINKGDIVRSISPELFTGKGVVLGFESRLTMNGVDRETRACVLWFDQGVEFYHNSDWLVKVEDRGE